MRVVVVTMHFGAGEVVRVMMVMVHVGAGDAKGVRVVVAVKERLTVLVGGDKEFENIGSKEMIVVVAVTAKICESSGGETSLE